MSQGQQRQGVKGVNAKDGGDSRIIKEMHQQHSKTHDANKFDGKKMSGHHGYAEKKDQAKKGCNICGRLHGFRNYPALKSLNTMIRERKEKRKEKVRNHRVGYD